MSIRSRFNESHRKKVLIVIGTRPEAIKMAPVIRALSSSSALDVSVLSTGQHAEMLDEALGVFELEPDFRLSTLDKGQSLSRLGSRLLSSSEDVIVSSGADLVLVHGDTSSAMFSALAAFNLGVPVGHVEAGLRTGNIHEPFPEEWNRVAISKLSRYHFSPTSLAAQNLVEEGVDPESIHVVGNTVVDSVRIAKSSFLDDSIWVAARTIQIKQSLYPGFGQGPFALITLHRRENAGTTFESYLDILAKSAIAYPEFSFVFPVHPNPAISNLAEKFLGGLPNVFLTAPIDYLTFSLLLSSAAFVISDSGGLQEEAVTYSKRLLLCRTATERPEAVEAGLIDLIGGDFSMFAQHVTSLCSYHLSQTESNSVQLNLDSNPYGDGFAADRIATIVTGA